MVVVADTEAAVQLAQPLIRATLSRGGPDGSRPHSDPQVGASVLPSARTLGKGLAVLRIFMGLILFANGVAKLFGFSKIEVGPYVANLIDRDAARFILQFEV